MPRDAAGKPRPIRELRGAVVVLGAGASRASGLAWDKEHGPAEKLACLPPLNADFFTHMQRITQEKYERNVHAVTDDLIDLFGSNFRLTLEDYFTQLEFLIRNVQLATRAPEELGAGLSARRSPLMAALGAVLETSTMEIIRSKAGCHLHRGLVERLRANDTIISFNYDCLIDDALRRYGTGKWNPEFGYDFAGYDVEGTKSSMPAIPRPRSSPRFACSSCTDP